MIASIKLNALRETHWSEYAIRFVLGGTTTVLAGLIGARFGPVVGGLFLAFPAIFPASATMIDKHIRERKEKAGLLGVRRGQQAAALDALGATLGSIGLATFAVVIWQLIKVNSALALFLAMLSWFGVSIFMWHARRQPRVRMSRRR